MREKANFSVRYEAGTNAFHGFGLDVSPRQSYIVEG